MVRLAGLYESSLNSVLVTEYLAGGDLVTRTAPEDYNLTERKCQIFIRQVTPQPATLFISGTQNW